MNTSQFFYLSAIELRACKLVWKKFKINRHEVNILMGLSAYLLLYNKQIVSRKLFTDWLGTNYRLEKKCWGYIYGLINKGCLHRLSYRGPNGNSLCISEYGVRVLEYFEDQLTAIEKSDRSKRSKHLTYKDLSFNTDNLPKGYILMQKGRDN